MRTVRYTQSNVDWKQDQHTAIGLNRKSANSSFQHQCAARSASRKKTEPQGRSPSEWWRGKAENWSSAAVLKKKALRGMCTAKFIKEDHKKTPARSSENTHPSTAQSCFFFLTTVYLIVLSVRHCDEKTRAITLHDGTSGKHIKATTFIHLFLRCWDREMSAFTKLFRFSAVLNR